ncbi:proto-oncogene tyrosine-protein kinase ROS-like isoform X2 [Haliotis asinina]|uniref:proto-oncogene tyrosine-protein kinase ROS-like isoform X2 n=1 Tax=Haliotis asinina TaxID=109174 RepID=UPI00353182AC
MIVHTMSALYVFIFIFLWISLSGAISNVEHIKNKCKGRCGSNLIQSSEGSLLFCDEDCGRKLCQDGCTRYQDALSSSCQEACSKRIPQDQSSGNEAETQTQRQYCIQGCLSALDFYGNSVARQLGPLPKPTLKRSSINYSSIVLQWTNRKLERVTYLVYRKILDIPQVSSDWQIHNSSRFEGNSISIYNLHPYVTYKFRVLVVISPQTEHVVMSPETFPITTVAHGVPASAPKITSLSAPSPSVISIAWDRPAYTNGDIVAYKITIDPVGHPSLRRMTKDILGDVRSWTVGQLQPSQKYVVTVAASNRVGEGPADVGQIRTPNPVSANETPFLILGSANRVLKQNLINIMSLADTILEEENKSNVITGVGIHIRRQLFIVSDSNETVQQITLSADTMRNMYPSILKPTVISVDWLNDRVYILSRNRIFGCPLARDDCIVVVDGLTVPPGDLKVDPVNGFLYFTQDGEGKGLYRIDLADINPKRRVQPTQIVTINHLKAFMIDFETVRLYFPNHTQNTMLSSFVDGSDIQDIRPNVIMPNYEHIISLTGYDNRFYWTNGSEMMSEEFDPRFEKFRHNELLFFDKYYRGLNMYHPRMQPTPVPHAAPKNLQALFEPTEVHIKWDPPPLLQYQGRGAWNQWDYQLLLFDVEDRDNTEQSINATGNSIVVQNLQADTRYNIRVRAVSESGLGPWSEIFIGRTLKAEKIPVRVLMSMPGRIIETDLSDNTNQTLVNTTSAKDIAWHNNMLMWVSEDGGYVKILDHTKQIRTNMAQTGEASCLEYDWLGRKIFWSEYQPAVIKRSDINSMSSDFIYQATARDMAIDSTAGRLYWATGNTVESTFLNGEDHVVIDSVPFFQGKQIISLVINLDLKKVLWYIKAFENQDLYMADLISAEGSQAMDVRTSVREMGDFKSISTYSGIQYYSHHLFWMDQSNALVVGDMDCKYTSIVSPHFSNITAFSVKHPSIHSFPDGFDSSSLRVIPKPLWATSIKVVGPSYNFNLTWDQAHNVTYGKVFYKVYIQIAQRSTHVITSKTWHPIEGLSPYTQMTVSIQPYTYWGYTEASTVSIRSPMAVPTAPLTPRVYITQPNKNNSTSQLMLAADFRWSNPHAIRGVLSHHFVYYWEGDSAVKHEARVGGVLRHFILNNLLDNKSYFFQVKGCTEAGCGELSEIVSAVTDVVNPVPRLLIANKSSVSVSEMDGHLNSTVLLPEISPTAMTFLAQDVRMFWIEKKTSLYVSQNSTNTALIKLDGVGKDMSIDWISRTLYVVEKMGDLNRIMAYDIDKKMYREIMNRSVSVGSVLSDPYTSSLFWTENDSSNQGHIFHKHFNSNTVSDLLGGGRRSRRSADNCTCSDRLNVSPVVAMDYSNSGRTEIVFIDMPTYTIMATDVAGCQCRVVFKATASNTRGLPPSLLAVDHLRVYWYNKDTGKLYSVNKKTGRDYIQQSVPDVQDIVAYGDHLQPLPDSDCLDPGKYSGKVTVEEVTDKSIGLLLDAVTRPKHCKGISTPQDKYTAWYKQLKDRSLTPHTDCRTESESCQKVESYDRFVNITGLEPYTKYLFQVTISNYYTEYLAETAGKEVVQRTKQGVPSPAQNVTAFVVNPRIIRIEWNPPLKLNGPLQNISYVVKWSTLNSKGHNLEGQTRPSDVRPSDSLTTTDQTTVTDLSPSHTYTFTVRAYGADKMSYSETKPLTVTTYMDPNPITLKQSYSNALEIEWLSPSDNSVARHTFWYSTKKGSKGRTTPMITTRNNTKYTELIPHLDTNTEYTFQIRTMYKTRPFQFYSWPGNNSLTFKTLTDVPDQPDPPVEQEYKTQVFEILWEEPHDNGEPISNYILEYSQIADGEWTQVYNGSDPRWVVDEHVLEPGQRYLFRVAAENKNGLGPFSDNSSVFATPIVIMDNSLNGETTRIVIAVVISFVLVVAIIIIIALCFFMRRRKEERKKTRQFISMYRVPDMELATLRELPHTTVQQSNTLYAINITPTAEDIEALPHFMRDQLTLTKFLGSGAFGEVFMGVARDILSDSSGDTKVAVKTLRKSASEHEKEEFLKEALLMSNFRHAHILSLLGVCLDNDPQFIIMELMEGGDLLSFLRGCRATTASPAKLLLPDLVKVCVHVARGCKYLEEMHFVHRDLAARNCLVSKKDPSEMVIKIGDFGLARDIYKNDYYRKEGEGLLPVRWMSPESLVDGVFTTPSDIWAFGVLMWEVVTLGQQPYPARTNIEVLHFVRAGGKLERPEKCADEMFGLMQKCWSFSAEDRPSFSYILQGLEEFQEQCNNMSDEEIALRSPTHLDVLLPRSARPPTPSQTISYYGLANLAFDDEVMASCSSTESEEVEDHDTTCIHQRSQIKRRGGGSLPLSPTSRRNKRMTLLGGAEATDKLTVDLSTANPMKRTSSLDSKCSSVDDPRVSYSQIQRQRASEIDALGYLQPRSKDMPKYLELINCAPEFGILEPVPIRPSPQSQTPSIPSSSSSPTTPTVNYTMMNGNYLIPSPPYGDSPPPPFTKDNNMNIPPNRTPPPMYGNPLPNYGVVSVLRNTDKPPPYQSTREVSLRLLETASQNGRKCKVDPSHSDKDLYSSPAYERHLSDSSSNSESGYYCVECLNNSRSSAFRNEKSVPTYSRVNESGFNSPPPNYTFWANNNTERTYSGNIPAHKDIYGCPPEYINVHGQGRTSRNQVFPEHGAVLAGFDIAQASLV